MSNVPSSSSATPSVVRAKEVLRRKPIRRTVARRASFIPSTSLRRAYEKQFPALCHRTRVVTPASTPQPPPKSTTPPPKSATPPQPTPLLPLTTVEMPDPTDLEGILTYMKGHPIAPLYGNVRFTSLWFDFDYVVGQYWSDRKIVELSFGDRQVLVRLPKSCPDPPMTVLRQKLVLRRTKTDGFVWSVVD